MSVFILILTLAAVQWVPADIRVVNLPPLQVDERPARAHTQGLELVGPDFFVTARREDLSPKRALLLRTRRGRADWDVWDVTPSPGVAGAARLDHPGGLQSDGQRLWIPVAESFRYGRTVIRVFSLERLRPGQPAVADWEFPVTDHVGALAVDAKQQRVFGASWDTETVYVWDYKGHLQRTLRGAELRPRKLGARSGADGYGGLTVQDWKTVDGRLFASGLFRDPMLATETTPRSKLLVFSNFLDPTFECEAVSLPTREGGELAREAMAVSGRDLYFLPDDLGATNRLYRVPLTEGEHVDSDARP